MPQALAFIATAVSAAIGGEVAAITGSIALGGTVATVAYAATEVVVVTALAVAVGLATAPKIPNPASVQVPLKQAVTARRSAFGEVRVSGIYALFEAVGQKSYDVLAFLDGRSDSVTRWYFNDDRLTLVSGDRVHGPDGIKYESHASADRCVFHTRLGIDTETSYSDVTSAVSGWTSSHRGDGITSGAVICQQLKQNDQIAAFPNGLPQPSIAVKAQLIYDPRDDAQVQGDKSTYVWSDNPALCLLAYLTDANGGVGLDYATRIFPAIDTWIAAANDCDADEATSDGTEKRYRCAGTYLHDNAPGDVIRTILDAFDGFMPERGDGSLALYSGRYVAPTVIVTDRQVLAYSVNHYIPDEQATNEFAVTFTDPDTDFNTGDAGTVSDDADIAARGVVRSSTLDLTWVPSASQAVRLAKRKLARTVEPLRGSLTLNLMGLNVLGERYIELQITDNAALTGVVVEITGPAQIDLASLTVTFPFIAADTSIDDGDPGAGVTPPGVPDPRPAPSPLIAPTITDLTAVYDASGSGVAGARIEIAVDAPITSDVQWRFRWRLSGDSPAPPWTEGSVTDADDGASVDLLTGFVPATGLVDVEVAYLTAAQTSPWSDPESITLAAPNITSTTAQASEDIAANDFVNIYDAAGSMRVRRADATDAAKFANGFAAAAILSGASGDIRRSGLNGVTITTTASRVWLSETVPGGFQTSAPSADGSIVQPLGVAIPGEGIDFTVQPFAQL